MERQMLSASQFCEQYTAIVEEFDCIAHPNTYPAIRKLYCIDPHDLVTPFACFVNKDHARGFVASLLMNTVAKMKKESVANG